ncbi:MAG: adenylate/guanylate cyclase domain-containing protein [Spirochaetaceae bacterium]|jgi:adenylate cyclase|nr:adenylate/guanylate cyclase domain-containing protein [Spirochaetaceae bacterium]
MKKKARTHGRGGMDEKQQVSFPIRAKLIIIITVLLLASGGLITTLVAFFVSRDVEKTAWTNNESINEMSSATAEVEFTSLISKVSVLLSDIFALSKTEISDFDPATDLSLFFFRENPDIAALITADGLTLRNDQFLNENNIRPEMIEAFLAVQRRAFDRAVTGQTMILNAAPVLNGLPILVIFFRWQGLDNVTVCAAFFSSESITTAFGTGTNSTMLINDTGDILVTAESSLLNEGVNFANRPFVQNVLENNSTTLSERYRDRQGREFFGISKRLATGNAIAITTIPTDVVFEGINMTTKRNIYLSIGVWFVSVLFLWFFAKSIAEPLRALTKAAKEIEDGAYHLTLKSKGHDETSLLTQSVVSMSHVLENFESFTNKEIARLARQGILETSGSDKAITMFFSDIRSFTAISEKISPNEVVEFLNEYMERMVACVLITGGAVDKFIGDAIMAYWGAVTTTGTPETDAFNGIKCALLMRASLKCFNQGRGGDKKPVIKIGCGFNSGNVVAGQIGSEERIVFTVIGDTVSLADRTETLNKPFGTEILMTEHTHKFIDTYFITEKMGEITEKGQKLSIYTVINIRDGEESQQLLADLEKLPHIDMEVARTCVGPDGPKTLVDLRTRLDIPTPDLSNLNLDEEEKKYSVTDNKKESA